MSRVLPGWLFKVATAMALGGLGAVFAWGMVGIAFLFTTASGIYESSHGDAWLAAHVAGSFVVALVSAGLGYRYAQETWEFAREIAHLVFPVFRPEGERFPDSDKEQSS